MNSSQLISELNRFINNPGKLGEHSNLERIYFILYNLCANNVELRANILGSIVCLLCKRRIDDEKENCLLRCKHSFHRACLKNKLMRFTNNKPYETSCETFSCPKSDCQALVGLDIIKSRIFPPGEWDKIQDDMANQIFESIREQEIEERKIEIENKQFECPICLEKKLIRTDCITLECDHQICKECLAGEFKSKLNDGKVLEEDRKCPHEKCTVPIDYTLIKEFFTPEEQERYLNFTIINMKSQKPDERFVRCPGNDCSYIFLYTIGRDTLFPTCIACKLKFCVHGCEAEHEGSTCEKYQEWRRDNNQADAKFNNFVTANNLRKCPSCNAMVERNQGCNFMTCRCKTHFCYVCGAKAISSHKCPNGHPTWG